MDFEKGTIVLVGGGRMGGSLLSSWIQKGIPYHSITLVEKDQAIAKRIHQQHGVRVVDEAIIIADFLSPVVVVFAVKPQVLISILREYRCFVGSDTLFLSIAAGKTIATIEKGIGTGNAVVRAMPNMPVAVGRGITVACSNDVVDDMHRTVCEKLLSTVGDLIWIDDEEMLDAVTAVSGGGPAYVYLLIECLAHAGIEVGLPIDLAKRLARTAVCGAAELAWRSSDPPDALRRDVTSPGGTTLAALDVLMADEGLRPLFVNAIASATARARELAD